MILCCVITLILSGVCPMCEWCQPHYYKCVYFPCALVLFPVVHIKRGEMRLRSELVRHAHFPLMPLARTDAVLSNSSYLPRLEGRSTETHSTQCHTLSRDVTNQDSCGPWAPLNVTRSREDNAHRHVANPQEEVWRR